LKGQLQKDLKTRGWQTNKEKAKYDAGYFQKRTKREGIERAEGGKTTACIKGSNSNRGPLKKGVREQQNSAMRKITRGRNLELVLGW